MNVLRTLVIVSGLSVGMLSARASRADTPVVLASLPTASLWGRYFPTFSQPEAVVLFDDKSRWSMSWQTGDVTTKAAGSDDAAGGFAYAWPTLLRYTSSNATNVALSITPGSPCTAACLRLTARF